MRIPTPNHRDSDPEIKPFMKTKTPTMIPICQKNSKILLGLSIQKLYTNVRKSQ